MMLAAWRCWVRWAPPRSGGRATRSKLTWRRQWPRIGARSPAVMAAGAARPRRQPADAGGRVGPEPASGADPLSPGHRSWPFRYRPAPRRADRARRGRGQARLLQSIPVQVYGAGGVSSLPVVNGLADDRVHPGRRYGPAGGLPQPHEPGAVLHRPVGPWQHPVYAGISRPSARAATHRGAIQIESAAPAFAAEGETRQGAPVELPAQQRLGAGANASPVGVITVVPVGR